MKKRFGILSIVRKMNEHYLKKTHTLVIDVHKSVAQAYALYEKNGNTLSADDITKEMKDLSPAFSKLYNGEIVLMGYQCVNCHMIFDVKMECFCCKAILVAG